MPTNKPQNKKVEMTAMLWWEFFSRWNSIGRCYAIKLPSGQLSEKALLAFGFSLSILEYRFGMGFDLIRFEWLGKFQNAH